MMFKVRLFSLVFALAVFPSFFLQSYPAKSNLVLVADVNGEITMATRDLVEDVLKVAEKADARLIVIRLNTPGGEVESVQKIMGLIESSEIPVCTFVYPPGSSAWSGGTYILMASHIAAMASGTTIGSCQPVFPTGEVINASKYVNALTALIVHHARLHSRNETAAELFVKENLNLGPEEALRGHVVELLADDIESLLYKLEGLSLLQCRTENGTTRWMLVSSKEAQKYDYVKRFDFDGISQATLDEYTPGLSYFFLSILYNPFVCSLLLIVGLFSLLLGIKTPGYGAELVGAICIFLALISFGVIGIEPAALVLFILGVSLIIAELKTGVGMLALGGALCIVMGSLMLFPSPKWLMYTGMIREIQTGLVTVAVAAAVAFAFIVYKVAQTKKVKVKTGAETLIGAVGYAVTDLKPKGHIRVLGEFWQARCLNGEIMKGEEVKVLGIEGLTLLVKRVEEKT